MKQILLPDFCNALKHRFLLCFVMLLVFACWTPSYGQGNRNIQTTAPSLNLSVEYTKVYGKVLDVDGKPISKANIIITSPDIFYWGKSKKDGSYLIDINSSYLREDEVDLIVTAYATGYKKQGFQTRLKKSDFQTVHFSLSPLVQDVVAVKGKGDDLHIGANYYKIDYNTEHPIYSSLTLYDLFCNLPCVKITKDGVIFQHAEKKRKKEDLEIVVNETKKVSRYTPESLKNSFSQIKATQVESIKVVLGGANLVLNEDVEAKVFIYYKE